MTLQQRIEAAKANLRRAEQAKTVAETQEATAKQQQQQIVEAMTQHGVTPETINGEIVQLEAKLNADLEQVERLIPQV